MYITLGAKGAVAINRNGVKSVAGFKVSPIDTTGAGDIYAGAVLFARSRNATPEEAARFGNFFAANLVTHYGARLQQLGGLRRTQSTLPLIEGGALITTR